MLEEFGRDLTAQAARGALDPLIGREADLKRLVDALCLEGKNSPVLVGPPGVGKTCIVEGFATLLAGQKVPAGLKNKRLFQLDFAAITSGTMYRGMLEERVEKIISELLDQKDTILFIDEIHQIARPMATGGFDFANHLKPYLAKGDFTVIGATTEEEFKRYIEETDPALARRFLRIRIAEPPKEELRTLLIRMGKRLGAKYHIVVPEFTIDRIISLADQYVKDRFFPDKAIDLMKEAIAEKRFSKSDDSERRGLLGLEKIINSQVKAIENGDLKAIEANLLEWANEKNSFFHRAISDADIAEVIYKRTGLVVGENRLDEISDRIGALKNGFITQIIGQNRAKDAILSAVKMMGAGIRKRNKPIGSFLFLGPSGSGKTETAKTIARTFFGDEKRLIRFDMSEFYDDHTMARLVGSPPGYIGSDEDGLLVKLMRKNPFSVVLFDEIEKADPKLFDIFLQMLDEGHVSDMKGNTASFKDALIIITSNVGTQLYAGIEQSEFEGKFEQIQTKVLEELKRKVRPEIINRIDHIIPFSPFTREELRLVFRKLVKESSDHINEQKSIEYSVSERAVDLAIKTGYDPQFGARPMRRIVQHIEEIIAEAVIERRIASKDSLLIDVDEKKYVLRKKYEK